MQQDTQGQTMHIGELAERTGLSLRSIRHYDDIGLLPPSSRSEGGFRVYSEADYARLLLIMQMKPLGFSLEEIAELLPVVESGELATPEQSQQATDYLQRAIHKRAKLARYLEPEDELISRLEGIASD